MTPEQRLEREGLALPMDHPVVANYVKTLRAGPLVFVSGHGAFEAGVPIHIGKLGAGLSVAEGYAAAQAVMINILGTLKAEFGELAHINRFLKVLVFVNATPDFSEHHLVANGATDVLVKAFGDVGRTTRSAIGVASLPFNFAVEIEATVEVREL